MNVAVSESSIVNKWKVDNVSFYTGMDIEKVRREINSDKCIISFGPWVGDLYLELNYWSNIIRYLKLQVYRNDLFVCSSFIGNEILYGNMDEFFPIDYSYINNMKKQYGPNMEFYDPNIGNKLIVDFFGFVKEIAEKNNIEDVIIVLPTNCYKEIIMGIETFIDFEIDRNFISTILTKNISTDDYICVFPTSNGKSEDAHSSWPTERWKELFAYLLENGNKVVLSGYKRGKFDVVYDPIDIDYEHDSFYSVTDDLFINYVESYMDELIRVIGKSKFCICSSPDVATLCAYCKKNVLFLVDNNFSFNFFLQATEKLIDYNKSEILYDKFGFLQNIPFTDVVSAVDRMF